MNITPKIFFTQKENEYKIHLKKVASELKYFGWFRFLSFVLIFIPFFVSGDGLISLLISIVFVILFFILIKKNIQLETQKRRTLLLKKITEDELLALNHSFSQFKPGTEFFDTNHNFAYDLDLFGNGSLFQFLNRTVTSGGQQKLAHWLSNPELQKVEIEKRQNAIRELSLLPEWRLHFRAAGLMFEESAALHSEIENWAHLDLKLKNASALQWGIFVIPAFTLLAAIPSVLGVSNLFLSVMILIQWILLGFSWKIISHYYDFFGRKSELLSKYKELLQIIEKSDFTSELLIEMQQKVRCPASAETIIGQLKKQVAKFEYRQNILVGFTLNSLFLWDIRCVYQLWKWHLENHKKLADWLNVISETDALVSLANFTANHPKNVFPEISIGNFIYRAEKMGHPLLRDEKRVCNDFEIYGLSKVVIVTGANMAGKSTFLRTVGVNLVLAQVGAPVCAEKFIFSPIALYTNMRTTDSLQNDESYFFAELKRIKGVLDLLQQGEPVFVILDEMLKGTNSVDKLNGSRELIRKLVGMKSVSMIATHDLKLSELENELPSQISNLCFEIRIENDELVFDYKLTNGVTQTMNATFLMKKMGII